MWLSKDYRVPEIVQRKFTTRKGGQLFRFSGGKYYLEPTITVSTMNIQFYIVTAVRPQNITYLVCFYRSPTSSIHGNSRVFQAVIQNCPRKDTDRGWPALSARKLGRRNLHTGHREGDILCWVHENPMHPIIKITLGVELDV